MKKTVHKAYDRGFADHGWLQSRHTFSFAGYFDPERMGFGALRVINDDIVAPGMGFGTHPHQNMEIISVPIEGELRHKDSEGNQYVIKKGEVQIMSAGSGILHSEYNNSAGKTNFLQIWVMPKKMNIPPRYEQKAFAAENRKNRFQTVVSPDGSEGSVGINQDAFFSLADIEAGKSVTYAPRRPGNGVYVFVISGEVEIAGETLSDRDGLALRDADSVAITAADAAEVLVMEVPTQGYPN